MIDPNAKQFANEFISFLNDACTAFHAVDASKQLLLTNGFVHLKEADVWDLKPHGKYFFTRNSTTIVAFTVGGSYVPGTIPQYTVIAAHTDSPCLKIKPVLCSTKGDALVLNTQPYGGGLWHTWFDRDLGLAGRVITKGSNGGMETRLFRINEPIARIPNLAIHLTSGAERESFAPNLQEHAKAILTLNKEKVNFTDDSGNDSLTSARLNPYLLQAIAKSINISALDIEDVECQLIDIQPSTVGGIDDEFIISGRLDNLCSTYQALRSVIDGSHDELEKQTNIRIAFLFDHEEIGSSSYTGAASSLFMNTLTLINASLTDGTQTTLFRSLRESFVVSTDMAHGLHPNYPGKHDASLAPKINGGFVIKHNANQRYATNSVSASLFRRIGKIANMPVQDFAVRSDSGCGSTVGPILATLSGILTVDVGTPQFSMHSIREMMGSSDAYTGYLHLKATLKYHPIESKLFENI